MQAGVDDAQAGEALQGSGTSCASCMRRTPFSRNFRRQTRPLALLVMRMVPPWSM